MQENNIERTFLIAGSGGQGILFMGKVLAYAAMLSAKEVTWFPSYGAEMRGGTAYCSIIVSDEIIASPLVKTPDYLVAFNKLSYEKFLPVVKKGSILLYDSSLFNISKRHESESYGIEASAHASEMGNIKSANMVMLGALVSFAGIVSSDVLIHALDKNTPCNRKKTLPLNKKAIYKGFEIIEHKAVKNT